MVIEACHKCSSDNICSYKGGFSQDVILSTNQLRSALQVLKGQVARKASALCVLWPKGSESRAGVSRWLGTAVPSWAARGHSGPCFVPACLDTCSFPYTANTCWLGMGVICFSVLFFPCALSSVGVCVGREAPGPVGSCCSSCAFVWSGRKQSSAQMVLWAPSICSDHACHKLLSPCCEFQVKEACLGQVLES